MLTYGTISAPAQVKETPREGVTQDMTGVAIIVEAAGGRERRHTCLTCGKSFYQKSHLKKHEVTHSDQKPFSCDKCERSYSSKESYKAHQVLDQDSRVKTLLHLNAFVFFAWTPVCFEQFGSNT
uniref:C2H2-type domain-containing protein n=1 Tax=Periophthalmus magnuspinnatus TaxID=409849 RepID=A0A3B4B1L5_9GOBI